MYFIQGPRKNPLIGCPRGVIVFVIQIFDVRDVWVGDRCSVAENVIETVWRKIE
jgi:hypothetical protein